MQNTGGYQSALLLSPSPPDSATLSALEADAPMHPAEAREKGISGDFSFEQSIVGKVYLPHASPPDGTA